MHRTGPDPHALKTRPYCFRVIWYLSSIRSGWHARSKTPGVLPLTIPSPPLSKRTRRVSAPIGQVSSELPVSKLDREQSCSRVGCTWLRIRGPVRPHDFRMSARRWGRRPGRLGRPRPTTSPVFWGSPDGPDSRAYDLCGSYPSSLVFPGWGSRPGSARQVALTRPGATHRGRVHRAYDAAMLRGLHILNGQNFSSVYSTRLGRDTAHRVLDKTEPTLTKLMSH